MPESTLTPLLGYGPLGIFCILLIWVCRALFIKYADAQEKRIDEALKSQEKLTEAIKAVRELRGPK